MNTTNKICSSNASQMWGTAAGSDGDSMPESPLSLDDGRLQVLEIQRKNLIIEFIFKSFLFMIS